MLAPCCFQCCGDIFLFLGWVSRSWKMVVSKCFRSDVFFFGLQSVLYSLIWDASIFMKHLLISCFWTLWYSLQPWDDWGSKLISLIHFFQHVKKPGVICCPFPAQMTWAFSAQVGWAPVPPSSRPKLSLSPASWSYAFRTGQVGLGGFFDIFQLCWMKVTKNQELYEFATFIILWPFWRSIDIYIIYYIYIIYIIYILYIYIILYYIYIYIIIYIHCGWWSEAIRPLTVDRGWFNHPILGPMIWYRTFRWFKFVGFPF